MLIPFRSKAAGDFFMFDHNVRPLFELMGKPFAAQGAMTGQQAGVYAAVLEAALAAQSEQQAQSDADAAEPNDAVVAVGLKQRAWPLIDMMRRAATKNVDVVWGSEV